jgi:excinuclease UvrABC ATPase subunit
LDVDLGPEGGENGGQLLCVGTLKKLPKQKIQLQELILKMYFIKQKK